MPETSQSWRVINAVSRPTFETQLVSFQGGYGFTEKFFGVFVARFNACNINLFPFDRHIVRFEYGFDGLGYLGADAVTFKGLSMVAIVAHVGQDCARQTHLESKWLYICRQIW